MISPPSAIFLIIIVILAGLVVFLLLSQKKMKRIQEDEADGPGRKSSDSSSETIGTIPDENEVEVGDLREQLTSFHQAMELCPSPIIITDLEGRIGFANTSFSEISGYRLEEVVGRNPRFLKSGNMDPSVYQDLWDTITRGETWRGELENISKNGRVFWEWVSISPVNDARGAVVGYFALKVDITERKASEDDARRLRMDAEIAEAADQAKAVFLKVMGEKMRNPLNRILGFTNLLSQSSLKNDQLTQLNQVGSAGLELLALINRILEFTKAETGTIELESEPFNPAKSVERLLKTSEQKAAAKNVRLLREISETLPDQVIGDENRFCQVLEHLVENAVQYTSEGTITVRLSAGYNEVTQIWEFHGEVTDTGQGMDPVQLRKLFKPFTQVEPGMGGGTGLGLALCQRLCVLQGGSLNAESEAGKGSTFSYELKLKPLDMDQTAVQVAQGPDGEQFALAYPIDILIAEDNRINRRLLETLMDRLGYKAAFAVDGVGVLAELKKKVYDLILMDLQMPNMSGIEAARRIRNGELGKSASRIRIIAITAFTTEENLSSSQEVGMDAFLTKPFDIPKIKREIIHAYENKMEKRSKVS